MAKPLAGRRAFEAMGRSAAARRLPLRFGYGARRGWPEWARIAYIGGWLDQAVPRHQRKGGAA